MFSMPGAFFWRTKNNGGGLAHPLRSRPTDAAGWRTNKDVAATVHRLHVVGWWNGDACKLVVFTLVLMQWGDTPEVFIPVTLVW